MAAAMPSTPPSAARRRPASTTWSFRRGNPSNSACGWQPRRPRRQAGRLMRASPTSSPLGRRRQTSSTPPRSTPRSRPRSGASRGRPTPGCCGRSSSTPSCRPSGTTATRGCRGRRRGMGSAMRSGPISSTATSSRCPPRGNIRTTAPGIWPFIPPPSGESIRSFARISSCSSCGSGISTPMARSRPTSGTSPTRIPPCMAGRRCGSTASWPPEAGETTSSWKGSSRSSS